jgi:hypothetical protein
MSKRIEVTISFGDRTMTLSGPEDFVQTEVQRVSDLLVAGVVGRPAVSGSEPERVHVVDEASPLNERDFVEKKRPSGHLEIVAVLAYCLMKNGMPEFTADDVRRAYLRVGIRPPKVVAQSLRDAKNLKDFIKQGSEPGRFKLTDHGERTVVFDLPSERKG